MNAEFSKTKNGKSYKITIDGQMLYTNKADLFAVIEGDLQSCQFQPYKKKEAEEDQE